jgi:hypothetical protein
MKMSSNDASFEPIGKLFLIFFVFFYILTNISITFRYYRRFKATGKARVGGDKNGPNDARSVVWALGMLFFFLCFFILNNIFTLYLGPTCRISMETTHHFLPPPSLETRVGGALFPLGTTTPLPRSKRETEGF